MTTVINVTANKVKMQSVFVLYDTTGLSLARNLGLGLVEIQYLRFGNNTTTGFFLTSYFEEY